MQVAVAQHVGVGRGHLFQGGQRLLGPALLYHAQDGVEDDDGHDGDGIDELGGLAGALYSLQPMRAETMAATMRIRTRNWLN